MLSYEQRGRQGACRLAAPLGLVVLAIFCLAAGRSAADPFVYTSSNALAAGLLSQVDGNASVAVAPPAVQLALAALCAGASNGSSAFRQVSVRACAVALLRQQNAFLTNLAWRCTLRRSLHNVTFNQSTSQSAEDQAAAANETADSVADAWHSLPSGACSLPGASCASWTTTLWLHAPHAAEPVYQQTLRKCSAEVRGLPAQHAASHQAALLWLELTLASFCCCRSGRSGRQRT